MSNQRKANLFGCSSVHKAPGKKSGAMKALSVEQFLDLDEVKQHVLSHPDSVTRRDGEVFISRDLALRYLHLCGNKRLKKEFRKAVGSVA